MLDMEGHTRRHLDEEIQKLEHELLEMAALAEAMVGSAVSSLVNLDHEMAMSVLEQDDAIDEKDFAIETFCLKLLAFQQPTASDFRVVGTAIKMITDIERIGDLAVDIAKAGLKIEKELGSSTIVDIPKIATLCSAMIRQSLEAFVKRDLQLVHSVVENDDRVDQLYRELRDQIHGHMRSSPEAVVSDSWLLLAVHHLERIADHAVNIAERVSFMVTGDLNDLSKSHMSSESSSSL